MLKPCLSLLAVFSLSGCVMSTAPSQDVAYERIDNIESVTGCYQNLGEQPNPAVRRYLSQILWPADVTEHQDIEVVEVISFSANSLQATGLGAGKVLEQSEFVEGQHFELKAGKLKVTSEVMGSMAAESGNPFIGVAHDSVTLGIDKAGNAKLTEAGTFAGTAFIVIPVVSHISDAVRFVRTGDRCEMQ